jgi:hypothetical protein
MQFTEFIAFCGRAFAISWTLWADAANSESMRPFQSNLGAFAPSVIPFAVPAEVEVDEK